MLQTWNVFRNNYKQSSSWIYNVINYIILCAYYIAFTADILLRFESTYLQATVTGKLMPVVQDFSTDFYKFDTQLHIYFHLILHFDKSILTWLMLCK